MYYLSILHVVQKRASIRLMIQGPTQSMKHSSWIMFVLVYFPHLSMYNYSFNCKYFLFFLGNKVIIFNSSFESPIKSS